MTAITITQLSAPQGFSPNPLTEILRSCARHLIQQAVEAELSVLMDAHCADQTEDGRARLVRHGHLPERAVIPGIGAVPVKVPRRWDRGSEAEKVRFTSRILPPYLRKTKSMEKLLPWLYLKGISFTKRAWRSWDPMQRGYPRRQFLGSKLSGGTTMIVGSNAISAPGGLVMFGRMVSPFAPEWVRKNNVFWC